MALTVRSSTKFSLEIERISNDKNIPYMDSILYYCEKEGLDIDQIGSLVNQSLKEKIAFEAQQLNYIPKTPTLPL